MKHDHCTCTVEVSPEEVDAGADITLTIQVASPRKDGLRGASVSIRNHDGIELTRADLKKSDGGEYESNEIVLPAPRAVGEHVYRALVVAMDKDGVLQELASTEACFVVKPHAAQLNVWDVPPAIAAGGRFKFTVGVKCSAGCDLSGRGLSIIDGEGLQICAVNLGHDIWPGTDALYFAEVEAEAPQAAGDHRWEVRTAAWDSELPHAAGSFDMAVRVVSPPDCEVTVEAIDKEKQTPIKDARVIMHPYRAMTDENGIAKVKLTKGRYDILVSASKYAPVGIPAEVTADMVARAELDVDPLWEPPDEV